jgi:hypothetical protein
VSTECSGELQSAIDAAYRTECMHYSGPETRINAAQARVTTVKIVPRPPTTPQE